MSARVHLYWQLKRLENTLTITGYLLMPVLAYTGWFMVDELDTMVELLGAIISQDSLGTISFVSHHTDPLLLLSFAKLLVSSMFFDIALGAFLALIIPGMLLSRMAKKYGMCICSHPLNRHQNKHGFIYPHCKGWWFFSRCPCTEIRFIHDTPATPNNP